MYMKRRHLELIEFLLTHREPITTAELARIYRVGQRTVRYDLDTIEGYLSPFDVRLVRGGGTAGVLLEADPEVSLAVGNWLSKVQNDSQMMSDEEKVQYIALRLLLSEKRCTISQLADEVLSGVSSVRPLLKKASALLQGFSIATVIKPNYGIGLVYTESQWRRALVSLLVYCHRSDFYKMAAAYLCGEKIEAMTSEQVTPRSFVNLLNFTVAEITALNEAIILLQKKTAITLTSDGYAEMLIHLAVAAKRIRMGHLVAFEEISQDGSAFEDPDFHMADACAATLRKPLGILFDKNELAFIAINFLCAKRVSQINPVPLDVHKTARDFVRGVEEQLGETLLENDALLHDLVIHLEPMFLRLSKGIPIINPMLSSIKSAYPHIFESAKNASRGIAHHYGSESLPEDEIAYLTVHLAATLQRKKITKRRPVRALVLCASGIGSAKLLASRVEYEFDTIQVIKTASVMDLKEEDVSYCDLLITTVDLDYLFGIPTIKVSALLNDSDRTRVAHVVGMLEEKINVGPRNANTPQSLIQDILDIVERHTEVISRQSLQQELKELLDGLPQTPGEGGNSLYMLSDLLIPQRIGLGRHAENWEDAVRQAGQLLCQDGCIEERYIDCMVENIKRFGPYVVVAPGLAMPHSRPADGALKLAMSFVTLTEPVRFGSKENDPVSMIFALAAIDGSSHLQALTDIAKFVLDSEKYRKLTEETDAQAVWDLIQSVCKET